MKGAKLLTQKTESKIKLNEKYQFGPITLNKKLK